MLDVKDCRALLGSMVKRGERVKRGESKWRTAGISKRGMVKGGGRLDQKESIYVSGEESNTGKLQEGHCETIYG